MTPQPCPHEQSLGALKKTVGQLEGTVFGKDGINAQVIALRIGFNDMNKDLERLATSYSALAKSEIQKDAIEQAKIDIENKKLEERKKRSSVVQRLGTIFAIVFGAIGVLFLILNFIS